MKMVIVGSDHYKMGVSKTHGEIELAFLSFITINTRYWFSIPVASHLALMLCKDLDEWAIRDSALSAACLRKLDTHTWYLSPRHIALVLFSKRVDSKTKLAIVSAMQKNVPTTCNTGKPACNASKPERPRVYKDSILESFVSFESWLFFYLLGFQPTFFECVSLEDSAVAKDRFQPKSYQ